MSKILKALEKAQRDREIEVFKDRPAAAPSVGRSLEKGGKPFETLWSKKKEVVVYDQRLAPFFQPGSLAAEQFRKLRTHLLRLRVSHPPRTILVTSALDGEGKTLVATNLAAGIAYDLHSFALLVDCDLRNPRLGHWFGLPDAKGLSEYLTGAGEIPELLMKTEVDKLSILPGGSPLKNPTELIASKKMENLVQELKSRYNDRYIIFDSTPLLATSEPELLSRLVDGVLIVIRAGTTPRETIQQGIASLEKGKILGFVLNDLQFKSSGLASRYFGAGEYYSRYSDGSRGSKLKI
jgi:protein-tyrosine kinase